LSKKNLVKVKIILLSNAAYSVPSINFWGSQKTFAAVVCLGKPNIHSEMVEQTAMGMGLPFKRFFKNELLTEFKTWLTTQQPDLVLVFGCGYKIPGDLFRIPKFGFCNIHFSLLPAYRGRCPVFWQLKNGEPGGGITIHQMTEDYDAGPILIQHETTIFQGETHGLYSGRLSLETVPLIDKAIQKLEKNESDMLMDQGQQAASYAPLPSLDDLKINWETQSAKQVENLVNAANPDYGGAVTSLRKQAMRILEVTPAEIGDPGETAPGTIVYADINHGVFVACINKQFLRINVVHSSEGILSGFKMAAVGIKAGERFESNF
jgi:methionyl-tRNA formyltransferase